ncbi:hypothetical protein [Calothrix sp. PCC 6303]|uniref:hypothetical protein n=1 Tax=Calothrix sp. PCC 6303 TaxID=1170562 RepID=UPI0002A048E2|nr:hypothetical protein [Calothrix sp. PCC 6303]AFZ04566.1 hypothetical protein Cal6303_5695 [Calothrix sp. PCC 6303]
MNNCPVCNSEYTQGEVICPICSWDLTPYPLTFAGQIPDEYISKEKTKLNWAREIWIKLHHLPSLSQAEIVELQNEKIRLEKSLQQLQSQFAQEKSHLESQINILNNDKRDLSTKVLSLEQEKSQFQSQAETISKEKIKIEQERSHLQSQVAQITQENECLLQRIATYEQERSQFQSNLESLKQQQNNLLDNIKKLENEKSELQHQANRLQIQLKAELSQAEVKLINVEQERNQLQGQLQEVQAELDKANEDRERLRQRLSSSKPGKDDVWDL